MLARIVIPKIKRLDDLVNFEIARNTDLNGFNYMNRKPCS